MSNIKKKDEKVVDAVLEEKKTNTDTFDKPYFFPRAVAYIIDILLVSIVCSGILFLIPENKNYDAYVKEYEQIQTDVIEKKIDTKEYFNKAIDIVYDIDYSNCMSMIIEIVVIILYFVVFQYYNNGQTLGKKIMKLRVISNNGDSLSLNHVAYRALIINSVLINMLIVAALLFLGRNYYYYASLLLQIISEIIVIVTLIMIMFRKDGRGLHDIIAGTKVVQEN